MLLGVFSESVAASRALRTLKTDQGEKSSKKQLTGISLSARTPSLVRQRGSIGGP